VKLFQIEEPDGGPADPGAAGVAIGIDASGADAEVSISVGGNAVVLADREGFERALAVPAIDAPADQWLDLFARARVRAERALGRPATHAVIVLGEAPDSAAGVRLTGAAEAAGLAVLRLAAAAELQSDVAMALAAALLAEDLAPRPEVDTAPGADFT
jgi:hypothetical protein